MGLLYRNIIIIKKYRELAALLGTAKAGDALGIPDVVARKAYQGVQGSLALELIGRPILSNCEQRGKALDPQRLGQWTIFIRINCIHWQCIAKGLGYLLN